MNGYGSIPSRRGSLRSRERAVSVIIECLEESHASTENLLEAEGGDRASVVETLKDPGVANYVTKIKSRFFTLGLVLGSSFQMFVIAVVLMVACYSNHAGALIELSHEYYPVFRCMFLITMFFTLYGVNLFIWRRTSIDYQAVLGVTPHHSYHNVIRGAASMAYVVFVCFALYVLTITGMLSTVERNTNSSKHLWPALAVLLPLMIFMCPVEALVRPCFGSGGHSFQQRMGLLRNILAVLGAPFTETTFIRAFIADIFCSMPKIFNDLEYASCLYATETFWDIPDEWIGTNRMHGYFTCGNGTVLHAIGSVIGLVLTVSSVITSGSSSNLWVLRQYRDTRQVRHLFNGLKYIMSISMAALAIGRTVAQGERLGITQKLDFAWMIVGAVTTLYAFFWDTVMDWGLLQCIWESSCWGARRLYRDPVLSRPPLLRDVLYFSPKVYYICIAINFFLRSGWAFLISPEQPYVKQNYILVLGSMEVIRRFIWAIFRVEWEDIVMKKKSIGEDTCARRG